MCLSPSIPKSPPTPPPAASVTTITGEEGGQAKYAMSKERQRLAALQGRQSTILTGAAGDLSAANVQKKTLLG